MSLPARLFLTLVMPTLLAGCEAQTYKTVTSETVGTTTVALQTPDGGLKVGETDCQLAFTDAANKPVAVDDVQLTLSQGAMSGGETYSAPVTLAANGAGLVSGRLDLGSQGRWTGSLTWNQGGTPQSWTFSTMVL